MQLNRQSGTVADCPLFQGGSSNVFLTRSAKEIGIVCGNISRNEKRSDETKEGTLVDATKCSKMRRFFRTREETVAISHVRADDDYTLVVGQLLCL